MRDQDMVFLYPTSEAERQLHELIEKHAPMSRCLAVNFAIEEPFELELFRYKALLSDGAKPTSVLDLHGATVHGERQALDCMELEIVQNSNVIATMRPAVPAFRISCFAVPKSRLAEPALL